MRIIITESQKQFIINHYRNDLDEGWLTQTVRGVNKNIRNVLKNQDKNTKENFIDDLLDIEDYIMKHSYNYVDYGNWDEIKKDLIGDAVSDNFNGTIKKIFLPSGNFKVIYKTDEKNIYER